MKNKSTKKERKQKGGNALSLAGLSRKEASVTTCMRPSSSADPEMLNCVKDSFPRRTTICVEEPSMLKSPSRNICRVYFPPKNRMMRGGQ